MFWECISSGIRAVTLWKCAFQLGTGWASMRKWILNRWKMIKMRIKKMLLLLLLLLLLSLLWVVFWW